MKLNLRRGIQDNDRQISIISASVNLLLALVSDIIDSTKLESGVFSLVSKEFSIQNFIKEVEEIFHIQAEGRKNKLHFDLNLESHSDFIV